MHPTAPEAAPPGDRRARRGPRGYLPWAALLKLNVRTAMQYILLEVLSTKGVPKSKGKVPTSVSLFGEYFGYYVLMKKAG